MFCIETPFVKADTVMVVEGLTYVISHYLDVLGFYCPVPLYETKKAIDDLNSGSVIRIVADDPEAMHDIPMYIERTKHILHEKGELAGEYFFIIEVLK